MRKNLPGILLYLTILFGIVFLLFGCSPQNRLNRLFKNNPSLLHADTVYSVKTITVQGQNKDTTFKASANTQGIYELVQTLKGTLDSLQRRELVNQISNYVVNRQCLDDTLHIPLKNKGYVKIWQSGNMFFFNLRQPDQYIQNKCATVIFKPQFITKLSWQMFAFGVLAGWLSFFAVILFFKYKT